MKQIVIFWAIFWAILLLGSNEIVAGEKTFKAIAAPFPPFTSPDIKNKGFVWDLAKTALETQGYTVTLEFAPWARALEESKNGRKDGLLPAYWTKQRTQWFLYPTPLVIIHTGLMKRKNRKDVVFNGDFKTLVKFNIGVGKGYSTNDEFDSADYLNKVFVSTTPQLLKMLWIGNLDIAVGGLEYSRYYLNQIDLEPEFRGIKDDIIFLKPPLKKRYAYMVISKKSPDYEEKLKDFNIGMRVIMLDGTYQKIIQQYGFTD
ncbi:MAG: transporter substrate-binding domain-containing protein [Desulfobacteraceae bacterium]|nr:transporter substrate-binding domain-containing protein [Desulfobacteraceae bacterium]